ncbi:MAG: c-type cytochrome [Phormidesmis sp. FL-bin-119]|nr:c-type cytochrome [Pedobacter sp.]
MSNIILNIFFALLVAFTGYEPNSGGLGVRTNEFINPGDTLRNASKWPEELIVSNFAGPAITPSPACLAVSAGGEVYVGVDQMGSLGKEQGKGSIVKLIDYDNDGRVDKHTQYAFVDNPRGIIPLGNKLFVLHTKFSNGIASGMDLVVFEDNDGDGKADAPSKPLIQNISSAKFLQSRGTDHSTNGIRMGIDGWIYIAVGDFGFHNAIDRDGKKITMLGGGIVRVRPDGREMEIYTHGLRNIYDVAIDPYMNIFTRDNTNDGGGWNIRFSHQIQSGEYGYPLLFKHFTEEIIPALADLGGGSGTGSLFMDDPNWPEKYNRVPMMADWGNSQLYIHRLTPDGSSFKQTEESFIKLAQITDLDIDGSGRLYLSAWDGAGYSGSSGKGFVVRAVPKDFKFKEFPNLKFASVNQLAGLLKSNSAVARLNAQQELMTRPVKAAIKVSWKIASDKGLATDIRTAGIFTFAQIAGEDGVANLVKLTSDNQVKEFALRALSDRKPNLKNVPLGPFIHALQDPSPRVQVAALVGLGRLNRKEAIPALLQVEVPVSFAAPAVNVEGPHARPNSAIIPAHIAVRSLLSLDAVDESIQALGSANTEIALWAMRYMHHPQGVEGLISAYNRTIENKLKKQIISTLSRLYKKEALYEGQFWWSTRPDGHGSYYRPVEWESSPIIKKWLIQQWNKSDSSAKRIFVDLNAKNQMGISEFGVDEALFVKEEKVDLESIRNKKGQIGSSSIEDVMLAMANIKGEAARGKGLFLKQGCQACHTIDHGDWPKGPFMGQIGSIMSREQIAESILKPNASISQGFATVLVTTRENKKFMGFVTAESSDKITMRDIAGQSTTLRIADILSRKEMETSMMPPGLANSMSYEEFASLITYLSQQKK